jgi:1-acyl-sn-glycerol-3-phosphate acyltransferase
VPLVPCAILGAAQAWPPDARWPRPRKLTLRIGPPLEFAAAPNSRAGWEQIVRAAEDSVRRLSLR